MPATYLDGTSCITSGCESPATCQALPVPGTPYVDHLCSYEPSAVEANVNRAIAVIVAEAAVMLLANLALNSAFYRTGFPNSTLRRIGTLLVLISVCAFGGINTAVWSVPQTEPLWTISCALLAGQAALSLPVLLTLGWHWRKTQPSGAEKPTSRYSWLLLLASTGVLVGGLVSKAVYIAQMLRSLSFWDWSEYCDAVGYSCQYCSYFMLLRVTIVSWVVLHALWFAVAIVRGRHHPAVDLLQRLRGRREVVIAGDLSVLGVLASVPWVATTVLQLAIHSQQSVQFCANTPAVLQVGADTVTVLFFSLCLIAINTLLYLSRGIRKLRAARKALQLKPAYAPSPAALTVPDGSSSPGLQLVVHSAPPLPQRPAKPHVSAPIAQQHVVSAPVYPDRPQAMVWIVPPMTYVQYPAPAVIAAHLLPARSTTGSPPRFALSVSESKP